LRADATLSIHAVSGYSGRGREGIEAHEGPGASAVLPVQTYGLGLQHKHVPEIQLHSGLQGRPIFVPSYGNFRQGIALTIPIHTSTMPRPVTAQELRELLAQRYRGQRHVQVLDAEGAGAITLLDPQALNGSNDLQLAVFGNDTHDQLLLSAVFDNLGKGASGAAVQNLELMLGLANASEIEHEEHPRCLSRPDPGHDVCFGQAGLGQHVQATSGRVSKSTAQRPRFGADPDRNGRRGHHGGAGARGERCSCGHANLPARLARPV
jgi:N-acetyl-gamma-glutamylphosphate reductase